MYTSLCSVECSWWFIHGVWRHIVAWSRLNATDDASSVRPRDYSRRLPGERDHQLQLHRLGLDNIDAR